MLSSPSPGILFHKAGEQRGACFPLLHQRTHVKWVFFTVHTEQKIQRAIVCLSFSSMEGGRLSRTAWPSTSPCGSLSPGRTSVPLVPLCSRGLREGDRFASWSWAHLLNGARAVTRATLASSCSSLASLLTCCPR